MDEPSHWTLGKSRTHVAGFSHSHALIHGLPFQGAPYDKVLVLDLVKLIDLRISRAELDEKDEVRLTLFFIDSILAGLSAPVAKPKSVNLT
jgi:hypothetical protein